MASIKERIGKNGKIKYQVQIRLKGYPSQNDSVPGSESFNIEDSELILSLFGKDVVKRWNAAKKIYLKESDNVQFKLYKHTVASIFFGGHHVIPFKMTNDVINFFQKEISQDALKNNGT